jgi:hypothetical protein
MYSLTFTLRQHTPLIHFQHDQDGATLRATEVKPKLDRFIIKSAGLTELREMQGQMTEVPKSEYKSWFIGKDILSLNYKVRITHDNIVTYPIEVPRLDRNLNIIVRQDGEINLESFPCYFGNLGDDNRKTEKKFSFSFSSLQLTIQTFDIELYRFLEKEKLNGLFGHFFNSENFGTRQSKGFGSFSLIENSTTAWLATTYSFDVDLRSADDRYADNLTNRHNARFNRMAASRELLIELDYQRTLFNAINLFHKAIRSGYNQNGGYFKSALFKYFKEERNIQWDKKSIKEAYFPTALKTDTTKYMHDDDVLTYDARPDRRKTVKGHPFLVRDLLGLSSLAEWKYPYRAKITKSNSAIDRFKSPIIYKPILMADNEGEYFRVFIFLNPIPDQYFNAEFNIFCNGSGDLILETPDSTEFNLQDYFAFLASHSFNPSVLIGTDPVNGNKKTNRDTDSIVKFLNQLKENA